MMAHPGMKLALLLFALLFVDWTILIIADKTEVAAYADFIKVQCGVAIGLIIAFIDPKGAKPVEPVEKEATGPGEAT